MHQVMTFRPHSITSGQVKGPCYCGFGFGLSGRQPHAIPYTETFLATTFALPALNKCTAVRFGMKLSCAQLKVPRPP